MKIWVNRIEGSPPAGRYNKDLSNYDGETVEDNITEELVRGTKGEYEPLDHSMVAFPPSCSSG